jgi:hypothetical protein
VEHAAQVDRLRLVGTGREEVERAAAQEAHAVLRVADLAARCDLEEAARRAVRDATVERHLREVAEPVADDELRVAGGLDERGDRVRRVLSVGVDDEHGVRAARTVDAGAHRGALAALLREAHELESELVDEAVELARDVVAGAVVDEHE